MVLFAFIPEIREQPYDNACKSQAGKNGKQGWITGQKGEQTYLPGWQKSWEKYSGSNKTNYRTDIWIDRALYRLSFYYPQGLK